MLENDPYDWEKCTAEDLLTINAAAATAQQLTRLTPAYLGYLANAFVRDRSPLPPGPERAWG